MYITVTILTDTVTQDADTSCTCVHERSHKPSICAHTTEMHSPCSAANLQFFHGVLKLDVCLNIHDIQKSVDDVLVLTDSADNTKAEVCYSVLSVPKFTTY